VQAMLYSYLRSCSKSALMPPTEDLCSSRQGEIGTGLRTIKDEGKRLPSPLRCAWQSTDSLKCISAVAL
jgi:hypothetical protein